MGPQQAHREGVAARGRLYFESGCRWTLRSVRHGDVLFYCYVARNVTIPTWGSYERNIFFCVLVFWPSLLGRKVSAKVFRTLLVSGLHVGLHNSAIPAGYVLNATMVVFSKILL